MNIRKMTTASNKNKVYQMSNYTRSIKLSTMKTIITKSSESFKQMFILILSAKIVSFQLKTCNSYPGICQN